MKIVPNLVLTAALWLFSVSTTDAQKKGDMVYAPYSLNNNDTLLFLQSVKLTVRSQNSKPPRTVLILDGAPTITTPAATSSNITIDIKYPDAKNGSISVTGFSFQLMLGKGGGYWRLLNATMSGTATVAGEPPLEYSDTKIIPRMELAAPLHMSFHCGRFGPLAPHATLKNRPNATASIELMGFQLQTFMKDGSKFGRSYDCVGFFSIGILAGWFMTILLLGILSWGIKMVMSVHTMDRFDDPKGKTITVNATD